MRFCGLCGALKDKKNMYIHPYNKHNIQYYCHDCRKKSLEAIKKYWTDKGEPEYGELFSD